MKKKCFNCKKLKNKNDFSTRNRSPDGLTASCKECVRVRLSKRPYDPMRNKRTRLKQLYKMSLEDFIKMYNSQKGCCAICKKKLELKGDYNSKNGVQVDHCHQTQKIRGLLCHHCNSGIGYLKDDIKLLKSAIRYLEEI